MDAGTATERKKTTAAAAVGVGEEERTRVCDLPEGCVAHVIALTSPLDAARCAAVSPSFRDAAGSDTVWARFLPHDLLLQQAPLPPSPAKSKFKSKKEAYLGLTDAAVLVDEGSAAVWLAKGSGGRCVALSARRLSLPWDDGEFCWLWTPHPRSRFAEVAQLVDCTCLDIYGRLPTAALTPSTAYAAYLVFGTTDDGHRGLNFPDQETAVAVAVAGDHAPPPRSPSRHAVCLFPDDAADARSWFRRGSTGDDGVRLPARRGDGWWEVEMGRLRTGDVTAAAAAEEVVASFEVLGWYPKSGLLVEAIEFRPL